MTVHEKIRFLRQLKGWSQEDMAGRLNMSPNGYGSIERGETDVNLSRLEQIALIFEVRLSELFELNEQTVLNTIDINHAEIPHSPVYASDMGASDYESNRLMAESVLEAQKLVTEQKERNLKSLIDTFFSTIK